MVERIVVVFPGTPETSRNIAGYLRDLDIEIKIIPVIRVEVDWEEVERARKLFSSKIEIDLSIFTSKTAVRIVKSYIPEAWKHVEKRALAIGPGTASLLKSLEVNNVEISEKHSSIGLIEMISGKPHNTRVSLYCSKNVNKILEEFIAKNFIESQVFKLYNTIEQKKNIQKLVDLVESDSSSTFLIVVSSLQVLSILSKEEKLQLTQNIIYSAISRRIYEEAGKLNFKISHIPQTEKISEYYIILRKYIETLIKHG